MSLIDAMNRPPRTHLERLKIVRSTVKRLPLRYQGSAFGSLSVLDEVEGEKRGEERSTWTPGRRIASAIACRA